MKIFKVFLFFSCSIFAMSQEKCTDMLAKIIEYHFRYTNHSLFDHKYGSNLSKKYQAKLNAYLTVFYVSRCGFRHPELDKTYTNIASKYKNNKED